ncbi:Hypothetical predicted protein [Olea europaea subsp. europaea]|uniref:Uncharacterized protein n=1 Tax=Olea europaea subsp. europaea TaxID=158383 RepID=A0A8S0QH48_OLEEU|nr:Hypothetical predicted protein [Olea europaea subsp. europaea]
MGESEELEGLKRAYAEMILNTAKEAAARVMASEIKARNFELDLISSKEEATRILLRLKHMMDAKTTEAEITSLNLQRRIDELESQLNEAEGIILDLRGELNQVQEELVGAKNKNVHLLRVNDVKRPDLDVITLENELCGSMKQNAKWNSEHDICCVDSPVLSSIITSSKEPELCRNGCSQRIHAIETILVDEKLPSINDSHSTLNSEMAGAGAELTIPSSKIEKLELMQNLRIGAKHQSLKSCKLRRRRTQTGKAKAKSCKNSRRPYLKPHQTCSAISHCRSFSCVGNDFGLASTINDNINTIANSCGLEEKVNFDNNQVVSVVRRSLRKRKPKYWGDVVSSCRLIHSHRLKKPHPDLSYSMSNKVECSLKSGNNQLKAEDKTKNNQYDHGTVFLNSESSCPENQPENDKELMDVLVKLDEQAAQLDLDSFSQINCNLTGGKISGKNNIRQADSERHFKYTFSRKRKMESSIKCTENSSFGENYLKKRSQERDSTPSGFQNSTLMNKSSTNSRRVLQVARQLISFSGKHQREYSLL